MDERKRFYKVSKWMPIGVIVDYLMKHGGEAENSMGDTLEIDMKKLVFVKVDRYGRREVAKLADEVLEYNWKVKEK